MSGNSKIEWTEKTWNPVTGCTKVSQGCKHCYAERQFPRIYPSRAFTDVQCHEDRLDAPLHWRKSARIFVNSMSDLFHESVPREFISQVFAVMSLCPQHTFQILTKRPARMLEYVTNAKVIRPGFVEAAVCMVSKLHLDRDSEAAARFHAGNTWPLPNVWLGVSIEDQATADERIPLLLQTPAVVRWISYEPALAPVNVCNYLPRVESNIDAGHVEGVYYCVACGYTFDNVEHFCTKALNWVVCGGESGPSARPMHPEWARLMRDQCQAARVPFFFKQWGEWSPATLGAVGLVRGARVEQWMTPAGTMPGRGHELHKWSEAEGAIRIGKHAAGRLLDGVPWNEYPERAA